MRGAAGGCALLVWVALGAAAEAPPEDGGVARGVAQVDAGQPRPLSAEDQEVVQNLELLEHLDESAQLDLLMELSRED